MTASRPVLPYGYVGLMVTRRCNMTCGHCSVASSPHVRDEPTEADLLAWLRAAAAAGATSIRITGGEPMLRQPVVRHLVAEGRALGLAMGMTSNGFWGRAPADARRHIRSLAKAGLGTLTISVDRFHAAFQDVRPALHLAQAAHDELLPIHINFVRGSTDEDLTALTAPFEATPNAHLRFYDMQAVGRARELPAESFSADASGFCSGCANPTITDDGRLIACNGPAYFSAADSALVLGSLAETPVADLLQRHAEDPILATIRTEGPARLAEVLRRLPGFEQGPWQRPHTGMCDLCLDLTSRPDAMAALRRELSAPHLAARRLAISQVIAANREDGVLSWAHVNGAGFAQALRQLAAAPGHEPSPRTERLLRRADLDWRHRARYLRACGLARAAALAFTSPALRGLTPAFFTDLVGAAALQESIRELIQREALRRLDAVLADLGVQGVLLKGMARAAFVPADSPFGLRAAGDIDCLVDPGSAAVVREALLAHGFAGVPAARRTAAHHLAPVSFEGVAIELHTRIMPAVWGLPEAEMLGRRRPRAGFQALATLDAEGFLVHAGFHVTSHIFSGGLKTAWDVLGVVDAQPDLDWDRVARWVAASRAPRAFWVPMTVIAREMDVAMPPAFLARGGTDRRVRQLETVAARRLFHESEAVFDANPISRHAVMLLLHDSWIGRGRYLAGLLAPDVREARGRARRDVPEQRWRALPRHARTAWRDWRHFRRAAAMAARHAPEY